MKTNSILQSVDKFPIYEKVFEHHQDQLNLSTCSMYIQHYLNLNHPNISFNYSINDSIIEEHVRNIYQSLSLNIFEGQITAVTRYIKKGSIEMITNIHNDLNTKSISDVFNSTVVTYKEENNFTNKMIIEEESNDPFMNLYQEHRYSFLDSPVGCGKTYQTAIAILLRIMYYETRAKLIPIEDYDLSMDLYRHKVSYNIIVCCVNTSLIVNYHKTFLHVSKILKLYYPDYSIDILVNPRQTSKGMVDFNEYVFFKNKILIVLSSFVTKFSSFDTFKKYFLSLHFPLSKSVYVSESYVPFSTFVRDESTRKISSMISLNLFKNTLITSATLFTEEFGFSRLETYMNSVFSSQCDYLSRIFVKGCPVESKCVYTSIRKWLLSKEIPDYRENYYLYRFKPDILLFYWLHCSLLCPISSQQLICDVKEYNADVNVYYFDILIKSTNSFLHGTKFSTDLSLRFQSGVSILIDYICDTIGRKMPFTRLFNSNHSNNVLNIPYLLKCIESTKEILLKEMLKDHELKITSINSSNEDNANLLSQQKENEKELINFQKKFQKLNDRIHHVINNSTEKFQCNICFENEFEPCILSCCLKREICKKCVVLLFNSRRPCPFCRNQSMNSGNLEISFKDDQKNAEINAELINSGSINPGFSSLKDYLLNSIQNLPIETDARTVFEKILFCHLNYHHYNRLTSSYRILLILNDCRYIDQLSENSDALKIHHNVKMEILQNTSTVLHRSIILKWFEESCDKNALKILVCVRSIGIRDTMTGLNFSIPPDTIINLTDNRNHDHDVIQSLGRLSRMDIADKINKEKSFLFFNVKVNIG